MKRTSLKTRISCAAGVVVGVAPAVVALGELAAVVPEPPQAARASAASKTSSASTLATIVDDPRFP
jgi:hypothetical protein